MHEPPRQLWAQRPQFVGSDERLVEQLASAPASTVDASLDASLAASASTPEVVGGIVSAGADDVDELQRTSAVAARSASSIGVARRLTSPPS